MLKVLVSAYSCAPGKGSEPGVGWNVVRQIARFQEAWVITRPKNRAPIEAALAHEPMPNVHWIYYDIPVGKYLSFGGKSTTYPHFHYVLWQFGAYLVARRLQRENLFDLVHHVTFVNYWMPIFVSLLDAPFVWGSVGGGESSPAEFRKSFPLRAKIHEFVRDLVRNLSELNPFLHLTVKRAALALATTSATAERMTALGCRQATIFSAVGLPKDEILQLAEVPFRQHGPFRLMSIGDLLSWKGFDLGLRAFARFHDHFPESEYWLIGDGPERKRLRQLARELNLKDSVIFWGQMPREQVFEKLASCDILLCPSLHDSGGWVCLEAMAAGRPVVCLDLGGPGLQVTENTGVKVPAMSPEQVITDLAAGLGDLAKDPARRVRMSSASRERVRECFNWDQMGNQMAAFHNHVARTKSSAINSEIHPAPLLRPETEASPGCGSIMVEKQ
jgi:glycosyltransferase involved in cell wall biosynthesis